MLHHRRHTAGAVEVGHIAQAVGVDFGQMGGGAGNLVDLFHVQLTAGLVGNGREVQRHIGGAADGHAQPQGVGQSGPGDDLPGGQPLPHHGHNAAAGPLGHPAALRHDRGHHGAARQAHAHGLRHGAHGIGGAQIGAGAAAGAAAVLQGHILLLRHAPHLEHPLGLHRAGVVRLMAVELHAPQHGAAVDDQRRQVQPGRRHQQSGYHLVAGAQQHNAVKVVQPGHGLHLVGDQVPGGQDEVHPVVAAAHAVTGADDAEFHRRSAGLENPLLHKAGHLPQVVVARGAGAPGVGNADQRTLQVIITVSHPLIEGADGGPIRPWTAPHGWNRFFFPYLSPFRLPRNGQNKGSMPE